MLDSDHHVALACSGHDSIGGCSVLPFVLKLGQEGLLNARRQHTVQGGRGSHLGGEGEGITIGVRYARDEAIGVQTL